MGIYLEDLKSEVSNIPLTSGSLTINEKTIALVAKPLTANDMVSIKRAHPDFGTNPSIDGMIDLIILKARPENDQDTRAFDKADKPFLMRLSMNVIGTLFGELFGSQMEAANSEDTVSEKKPN